MRAAGLPPISTVAEPFTIVSGGPTHTAMSPSTAAGMFAMRTVGMPGPPTGPPTCGTGPVVIGQVCMSVRRAAGGMAAIVALLPASETRYLAAVPVPPEPPKPFYPPGVNLGLILDVPVLHQMRAPSALETTVTSTLQPVNPTTGTTTYVILPMGQIQSQTFEAAGARKQTNYHYDPVDPKEQVEAIEARIDASEAERKTTKDPEKRAALKARVKTLKETAKTVAKQAKKGSPPARLARATYVEESDGQVTIFGETVYEYEGLDIVKATTTTRSDEDPPAVQELSESYAYNDLGQLASKDAAGQKTEYSFDAMGRPTGSTSKYQSPAGDFFSEIEITYTYAPGPADPTPANAMMATTTTAKSGPLAVLEKVKDVPAPRLAEAMAKGAKREAPPPAPGFDVEAAAPRLKTVSVGGFDVPEPLAAWSAMKLGKQLAPAAKQDAPPPAAEPPSAPAPPVEPPPLPTKLEITTVVGVYVY